MLYYEPAFVHFVYFVYVGISAKCFCVDPFLKPPPPPPHCCVSPVPYKANIRDLLIYNSVKNSNNCGSNVYLVLTQSTIAYFDIFTDI